MIRKIARPMLASVYIADGVDTLVNTQAHVDATERVLDQLRTVLPTDTAKQIPNDPEIVARVLGGTKVGAGALLAIGKLPRLSAGVLALTAVPTILGRHAFWETQDPQEKSARRSGFLTNVALLGGLGITSMDTQGKPGLRWRASHAAQDASQAVQSALPTRSESESSLDNASSWISDRAEQAQDAAKQATAAVTSYVDEHKDEWTETAQKAASTAGDWFEQAREQGKHVAEDVQKKAPGWAEQARQSSSHLLDKAEQEGRKLADQSQKAVRDSRSWLDDAQSDSKVAKKRLVKSADKAQSRAEKALNKAENKSGRAYKRAAKQADHLQNKADKAITKAAKKYDKKL